MMTHASVFSGIGGAELASAWMGWTNLFHCEIQEFHRQVLEYWFPNSESYGDITTTNFEKWKGKVDVLTGGFPCQPFSVSGSRQVYEEVQSKKSDGAKFNRIGSKRHAAKKVRKRFRGGCDAFKGFPKSQPTICRGDDGLPFNVDHLTISERRWRKESIKAYGNAWVPQIAFEIFKAIEKVHLN